MGTAMMGLMREVCLAAGVLCMVMVIALPARAAGEADLSKASVVVRSGEAPKAERVASEVLVEEVEKRTGIRWPVVTEKPASGPVITLSSLPAADAAGPPQKRPEGYRLHVEANGAQPVVDIAGADGRGVLFGVGRLLRIMDWGEGRVTVPAGLDMATAPAYPIRGHQIGYRHTANSYDAWTPEQYDQYIRELALFGTNAIENIPFQDSASPVMPIPREEMNLKIAEICDKYDMNHWVWTPAEFNLKDGERRAKELERHEAFYRDCVRLNGVFFPGGDPGNNHPRDVMPFLKDLSERLAKYHPEAGVWLSLQGFDEEEVDAFFAYVEEYDPDWLTGLVGGPSSPPLAEMRERLPKKYRLRDYPDITHTILCQYPVAWWDPAYAFTLGREPMNPQPLHYARIHNATAPHTDGFITYSDGIHDDVNKFIWSALGWAPETPVREVLEDYARLFFRAEAAGEGADAVRALEGNWEGALDLNGAVDATYVWWRELSEKYGRPASPWRWKLHLFRATYDYFVRHRQFYEVALEEEVNAILAQAATLGANEAMNKALTVLKRVDTAPCMPEVCKALEDMGQELFEEIGYQTSVERYHARNAERGAVLDFLDRPLNNRWWLEDEFERIRAFASEEEKVARLTLMASWENPGPGSFYDDIGNVAKSPRVVRGDGFYKGPELGGTPNPDFGAWTDHGLSRLRLSSLSYMDWPIAVRYENLDPEAEYAVRLTGRGQALLRINGEPAEATVYGKALGDFKVFPVPKHLVAEGKLELTWDTPDEGDINWRQASILCEVWLLKQE